MNGKLFIGTSGWSYGNWQGVFYPATLKPVEWLPYYARFFNTVEINASFYHLLPQKTFDGWREKTPSGFIFSAKSSRFITHLKRLKETQEPLARFFSSVCGLGEKLGPILFQLPSNFTSDAYILDEFLKTLPGEYRYAFEFRHPSWLNDEIFSILKGHKAAFVIQDSPHWPKAEIITADFTYLRFHGSSSLYGSCYCDQELERYAKRIEKWRRGNGTVYAYFNNDARGFAVQNARTLKTLLGEEG